MKFLTFLTHKLNILLACKTKLHIAYNIIIITQWTSLYTCTIAILCQRLLLAKKAFGAFLLCVFMIFFFVVLTKNVLCINSCEICPYVICMEHKLNYSCSEFPFSRISLDQGMFIYRTLSSVKLVPRLWNCRMNLKFIIVMYIKYVWIDGSIIELGRVLAV